VKKGVRLGVDVGTVRVGVARSDPDGVLATPVATLRRDPRGGDLAAIGALVTEHEAVEVVVGVPTTLGGRHGPAAEAAAAYADQLAERIAPVPVRRHDERLTTVIATRQLAGRVRGRKQRAVVDQAAAVAILQSWLDLHRQPATSDRDDDHE
jgi:putative Holliday junction resolvase